MHPTFEQIWSVDAVTWTGHRTANHWKHPRRYYKVRSAVRMAFWIPICAFNVIAILSLAGGR